MNAPDNNHLDSAATEADRDSVAAASGAGQLDAPPSNRASNRCNGETFHLLSRHVDSLELSFRGELSHSSAWELARLKELARSRDDASKSLAQLVVGNHCFEVKDKGSGLFAFVLQNDCFYIKLSRPGNKSLPFAYCQIRNVHLLHLGPRGAVADLRQVLSALGQIVGAETVSRVDLAADFVTDVAMEAWGRKAWVTRIPYKGSHSDGEPFTGWTIGRKNTFQFGLYDKTFEVEKEGGKGYMYELWDKAGWAPWDTVWRAEPRFRRPILRQFGLDTLDDVLAALGGLWRYFTETSVRLTVAIPGDATRARWPNHPLWDALAAVEWDIPSAVLTRTYKGLGAPTDKTLAIRVIAALTSLMGREAILEAGPAWVRLREVALDHLRTLEFPSGRTPEEALTEKAREKGRRYGTVQNVRGTPAPPPPLDAAALAYRGASKGG